MEKKIKNLVEKNIGEYFRSHGGGLEIISFEKNVLKVELKGKCSNCPSAVSELETFIFQDIKTQFPEVEKIVLVNNISNEMIEFAKKILSKNL